VAAPAGGARWGLLGRLLLLVASLGAALTLADLIVYVGDLAFVPLRSRANLEDELVRSEFRTRVVTNELGFREPRLPGPKPDGTTRIVALGDSFTHGYGVEEDEAFPRVLEELLDEHDERRRYEVINLGVPGSCPLDYEANLRDVGLAYEPDLVVVSVMGNDVNDVRTLREQGTRMMLGVLHEVQHEVHDQRPLWKRLPHQLWPSLYDYLGARLRLPDAGNAAHAATPPARTRRPALPDDRWAEVLRRLGERHGRDDLEAAFAALPAERQEVLRTVLTGNYRLEDDLDQRGAEELMALIHPRRMADMVLLPEEYDEAWAETEEALGRLHASAQDAGAKTLIVYVPTQHQVTAEGWRHSAAVGFVADPRTLTDDTFPKRLSQFGAEVGAPVINLIAPLRARADEDLYFPIDGHWTPQGHRVVAELLAAAILPEPLCVADC
jgi:lysophospholipase L1-like esterase